MLMRMNDLLRKRAAEGLTWPGKAVFYLWRRENYRNFATKCTKQLGLKKLLFDYSAIEDWILHNAEDGEDRKKQ